MVQLDGRLQRGAGQRHQSCQTMGWITGKCGMTWIFAHCFLFPSRFDSVLKEHLESRAQEIWLQRPEQYSEKESGFTRKWSGGFWCVIYSIRLAVWKLVSSVEEDWNILDWEQSRNLTELDSTERWWVSEVENFHLCLLFDLTRLQKFLLGRGSVLLTIETACFG